MTEIIDLSRTLEDNLPVYPGDDPARLFRSRYLERDHYNDHRLEVGMHAGTHIDGPMHLTDSGTFISDLPVDSFIGTGCILDVRGQRVIKMQPEYEYLINGRNIVLLYTGQDKLFGKPEYFTAHPVVDAGLAEFLAQKKIKILGLDTPSPDYAPYSVHKTLMAAGILVLENLTNLDRIPADQQFEVIALPLKIKANGSPARVIARVL